MDQIQNENQWSEERTAGSGTDMVPAEEPKKETGKTGSVAGWRLLAVLFLLLGVGGLFLGLLDRVASFMQPVYVFSAYGTTLTGSLIGYAIDYLKFFFENASAIFSSGAESALSSLTELLLVAALMVTAVISIIMFIVAIASKKRAKRAALVSGVFVFLTYVGLFLWSYFNASNLFTMMLGETPPTREICDIPTAIVATASLLFLIIGVIASNRRLSINVILLIVPLLVAFLMCYPGTQTILLAKLRILSFKSGAFVKISTLFFMIVIAFNIVVSAIRIATPKHYTFDCFRFALMFIGAALTVISFIVSYNPSDKMLIFKGTQLFCTIGWLALTALAFVFSFVVAIFARRDAYANNAVHTQSAEAPIEEHAEPAEEPQAEPVAEEPAEKPAEEPVAIVAAVPVPLPEPEPEPQPQPEPQPEPVKEEAPKSEFERRMEALARGGEPAATQPAAQPPVQQPVYPPIAPHAGGIQPQQRMTGFGYATINQYTYDPFINTLTPQEKNEFGDLFIACKLGKFEGLPVYVIGGNNEEFFRKVFIYLGKFRKDISAELLDKLYLFVSKNG